MPHPSTSSAYGIWSLNEVRDAVRGENWPSTATNFSNVSLLINADGSIADLSDNNHSITINDGATVDTNIKKYGSGSMLFDGTNDRVEVNYSSAFELDGDFTIEMWVYMNNTSAGVQRLIGTEMAFYDGDETYAIYITTDEAIAFNKGKSQILLSSASDIPLDTWKHIAFARESGTLRGFVNGVQFGSVSDTQTYSTDGRSIKIGSRRDDTYPQYRDEFDGNIDDLRIVKGFAVYTSNFTPPTEALPTR